MKSATQNRATLAITGPHILKHHQNINDNSWRITVHNDGPAPASNVQIKLRSGKSEPTSPAWISDYPYPVMRVGSTTDAPGHQINLHDDENYEIIRGWKSESGMFFTNLNIKNPKNNYVQIQPEERWEFLYAVTAANAPTVNFTLQIFIESDGVKVARVG